MKKKDESAKLAVNITQFIFALILLVMILFSFIGCGTIKEIPVQTIEKEIIRDSLIYITDTITIEIPTEKIVQVLPADTTSQIATSLAFSEAKIEKGILTHSLEQKGQIQAKIDTCYITKTVEKIVEREVPVEVEVIKYKRDNIFWISIILNIVVILVIAFKIWVKIKV